MSAATTLLVWIICWLVSSQVLVTRSSHSSTWVVSTTVLHTGLGTLLELICGVLWQCFATLGTHWGSE